MIFETDGARYELDGTTLTRATADVMDVITDVVEVGRAEPGQRAVVITSDGRVSLTSRVRRSGDACASR